MLLKLACRPIYSSLDCNSKLSVAALGLVKMYENNIIILALVILTYYIAVLYIMQ